METIQIAILLLLLAVLATLIYVYFFRDEKKPEDSQGFLLLQQRLEDLTRTMDERMGETTQKVHASLQDQSKQSQQLIQDVNKQVYEQLRLVSKEISEVSESNKKVFDVGEQLQSLEKVLKHQKQRGNLGEASLQLVLENMLPPDAFKMQYRFSDGDIVDAVIFSKEGLIPIDAKFSLDNYRRLVDETDEERVAVLEKEFRNDLKKRIDETAKYIKSAGSGDDGTLPFAMMYIPAEAIYYDLIASDVQGTVKVNTRSLIDYAYNEKNVVIVSPTTFAAYLQSIRYGFRMFKMEESAKEIMQQVEKLSRHLSAYDEYFNKLGNSLGTTVNHYNAAQKEFGKVNKDVTKITGSSMETDPVALDRPHKDED